MCQKIKKNNFLTHSSGQGMSNVQRFYSDHPQFEENLLLPISHHAFDRLPSTFSLSTVTDNMIHNNEADSVHDEKRGFFLEQRNVTENTTPGFRSDRRRQFTPWKTSRRLNILYYAINVSAK